MAKISLILVSCLLALLAIPNPAQSVSSEDRDKLLLHLFANYQIDRRPVEDHNNAVTVNLKVALLSVGNIDDDSQSAPVSANVVQNWIDHRLKWEPSSHSGIESVTIKPSRAWTPGIAVAGSAQKLKVHSDGNVTLLTNATLQASCRDSFDTSNFPNDHHTCKISLKSDTYKSSNLLVLKFVNDAADFDVENFAESPSVLSHSAKAASSQSDDGEDFPELIYTLNINRGNAQFYKNFFVFPLMILCVFTACAFFMPPDSPAKIPFACAVFTSFFLLGIALYHAVLGITKFCPAGVPNIIKLYRMNLIHAGFAIIQAAFTFDMCRRLAPPGPCMRKIAIEYLAPIFLCTCLANKKKQGVKGGCCGGSAKDNTDETEMASKHMVREEGGDVHVAVQPSHEVDDSPAAKAKKISEDWYLIASVFDRMIGLFFLGHAIVTLILYSPSPL